MVQVCAWPSRLETHRLYLVSCWGHPFSCKRVQFDLYSDPPSKATRIWYKYFSCRECYFSSIIFIPSNNLCLMCCGMPVTAVIIYMLSGFCGSILSSIFLQHNLSVGASSALFGLFGTMLSELLLTNIRTISKSSCT